MKAKSEAAQSTPPPRYHAITLQTTTWRPLFHASAKRGRGPGLKKVKGVAERQNFKQNGMDVKKVACGNGWKGYGFSMPFLGSSPLPPLPIY